LESPTTCRNRHSVPGAIENLTKAEESMKIIVDFDSCEANGYCVEAAPELFELGDDDYLTVLNDEPGENARAQAELAAAKCPKRAITVQP
jgi:ferredoxin